MKDHWIRTWKLIRDYPSLVLPAIFASLLGLGMERLSRAALKLIAYSFATGHSVLGGEVPNGDLGKSHALLVVIPLGLAREFLTILVFVAALVVTGLQVRAHTESALPEAQPSVAPVLSRWRSILLFALAFMALMGALSAIGATALTYPATPLHFSPPAFQLASLILGLIVTTLVAWFLAPWSVRLLQQPELVLTPIVKMSARTFAIAAFALQPVLGKILLRIEAHISVEQKWEYTGLSIINTAVTNLPLALLFVALGLLAMEPASATTVGSEGQPAPISVGSDMSTGSESVNEA